MFPRQSKMKPWILVNIIPGWQLAQSTTMLKHSLAEFLAWLLTLRVTVTHVKSYKAFHKCSAFTHTVSCCGHKICHRLSSCTVTLRSSFSVLVNHNWEEVAHKIGNQTMHAKWQKCSGWLALSHSQNYMYWHTGFKKYDVFDMADRFSFYVFFFKFFWDVIINGSMCIVSDSIYSLSFSCLTLWNQNEKQSWLLMSWWWVMRSISFI